MKGLIILMFLLSALSVTSSFASTSTAKAESTEIEEGQTPVAHADGAKCDDRLAGKTDSNVEKKKKVPATKKPKKGAVQETSEEQTA